MDYDVEEGTYDKAEQGHPHEDKMHLSKEARPLSSFYSPRRIRKTLSGPWSAPTRGHPLKQTAKRFRTAVSGQHLAVSVLFSLKAVR